MVQFLSLEISLSSQVPHSVTFLPILTVALLLSPTKFTHNTVFSLANSNHTQFE